MALSRGLAPPRERRFALLVFVAVILHSACDVVAADLGRTWRGGEGGPSWKIETTRPAPKQQNPLVGKWKIVEEKKSGIINERHRYWGMTILVVDEKDQDWEGNDDDNDDQRILFGILVVNNVRVVTTFRERTKKTDNNSNSEHTTAREQLHDWRDEIFEEYTVPFINKDGKPIRDLCGTPLMVTLPHPNDLLGRTFLSASPVLEDDEEGRRKARSTLHVLIKKIGKENEKKREKDQKPPPTVVKFLVENNRTKERDVMTYGEILNHLERDSNAEVGAIYDLNWGRKSGIVSTLKGGGHELMQIEDKIRKLLIPTWKSIRYCPAAHARQKQQQQQQQDDDGIDEEEDMLEFLDRFGFVVMRCFRET